MPGIEPTMREFEAGTLHSGSKFGPRVTNRAQAIAIGLSEARKAGEAVPPKGSHLPPSLAALHRSSRR